VAGELIVFDAATRKEIKRIKVEGGAVGVTAAADGKRAYLAIQNLNSIVAIDLEKLEVVGKVETGAGPDGIFWTRGVTKAAPTSPISKPGAAN
jgi:DNA-binding beta-propeller fold protein YncE